MNKGNPFYGNIFQDYPPSVPLRPYVAAYWHINNSSGSTIHLPVVPDGSSDIIFYLNSNDSPFVVGLMSRAQLIETPDAIQLFGIRFCPGVLSFLLETDMRELTNITRPLDQFSRNPFGRLRIKKNPVSQLLAESNRIIEEEINKTTFHDTILTIIRKLSSSPELSISSLAREYGIHPKNLERLFYRHIGISPKKFGGIMRFYKAHKHLLHNGLQDLVTTSLESGYFDQSHFNREYKKLTGTHPTSNTMSILYNTPSE
ncbi:MAG: helix-turn-helix domain-containing protein [Thermodesulfobacteriota bacterium]